MKRISIIIFALCIFGAAQAQVGVYRSGYGVQQVSQDAGPLTRDGNLYYYHGKSMTEKEMVAFIQKDCERAYNYYKRNQKIEYAGWGLFGIGLGVTMAGVGTIIGGYYGPDYNPNNGWEIYHSGYIVLAAGVGITCVLGVPIICVGAVRKKNAHKVYNQYCGVEETANNMELKLTSGNNGLGLALSF